MLAGVLVGTAAACDTLPPLPDPPEPPTLATYLSDRSDLTRFTAVLARTGLYEALRDPEASPLTLFAPTDEAFERLLTARNLTWDDLLISPGLVDLVRLHMAQGYLLAPTALQPGAVVQTLRPGGTRTFRVVAGSIHPGLDVSGDGRADALLIARDVETRNGVIHFLDRVLVPADLGL